MHPVTPAGVLTGRDDELALLDGLLRDLARGSGNAVLIEGEPGIGKTALVRAALSAAALFQARSGAQ
jgi:predicted ATPase